MEKCKYEGTGIWDGRCVGTKEVDPYPGYDKCKQYKPNYISNADRIRGLTDDELAKEFIRHVCCPPMKRRHCTICLAMNVGSTGSNSLWKQKDSKKGDK